MISFILAVAVAAGVIYLLSPAKPTLYRGKHQADLPLFFYSMLQYMAVDRGVLHVQHEGSDRLLLFRKVALPGDQRGFTLELPNRPSSRARVSQVREALTGAGFQCTPDAPTPDGAGHITIVNGLTAIEAFRVAEIARGAIGLDVDAQFTIHMAGPPSLSEIRRMNRALR